MSRQLSLEVFANRIIRKCFGDIPVIPTKYRRSSCALPIIFKRPSSNDLWEQLWPWGLFGIRSKIVDVQESSTCSFARLIFFESSFQFIDLLIFIFFLSQVETIGDCLLVVSGLPVRNGNRHAGEIADMAFDILSLMTHFKIRHRPRMKLQLRVGLHSGNFNRS